MKVAYEAHIKLKPFISKVFKKKKKTLIIGFSITENTALHAVISGVTCATLHLALRVMLLLLGVVRCSRTAFTAHGEISENPEKCGAVCIPMCPSTSHVCRARARREQPRPQF